MRWRRNRAGKGQGGSEALAAARARVARAMAEEQWDQADRAILAAMQLLRDPARGVTVTQSVLAELHGQWGLALEAERRYQEAFRHLSHAERLFNLDERSATAWAANEGIVLQGEGEPIDLRLALRVLVTLADTALRLARPNTRALLAQVVEVADLLGDQEAQWTARRRLAAFTGGLADWEALLLQAREMGILARRWASLPHLLDAMREFAEAHTGLQQLDRALEAQRLTTDLARFLADPSLPNEERELAKLAQMQP